MKMIKAESFCEKLFTLHREKDTSKHGAKEIRAMCITLKHLGFWKLPPIDLTRRWATSCMCLYCLYVHGPVSYTHLDVYKRQA